MAGADALAQQLKRLGSASPLIAQHSVLGVFALLRTGSGITPALRDAAVRACTTSACKARHQARVGASALVPAVRLPTYDDHADLVFYRSNALR